MFHRESEENTEMSFQDGGPKVNSIFEKARALGATEGSIADLQQPGRSGAAHLLDVTVKICAHYAKRA